MHVVEEKMPTDCLFYCLYLDDIFVIFKSIDEANNFLTKINKISPQIQFTQENKADSKLVFLDVKVINHGTFLSTKWFF